MRFGGTFDPGGVGCWSSPEDLAEAVTRTVAQPADPHATSPRTARARARTGGRGGSRRPGPVLMPGRRTRTRMRSSGHTAPRRPSVVGEARLPRRRWTASSVPPTWVSWPEVLRGAPAIPVPPQRLPAEHLHRAATEAPGGSPRTDDLHFLGPARRGDPGRGPAPPPGPWARRVRTWTGPLTLFLVIAVGAYV